MPSRKILPNEEKLLDKLIEKASLKLSDGWKDKLLVESPPDAYNRILVLYPKGIKDDNRLFGSNVSELMFNDKDGTPVSVALYLDEKGELFELDIWKVDFTELLHLPDKY